MPQDLLEFALAEVLRRLPDADVRPGSHLRTLVEAAVRSGQPINLPSPPRRIIPSAYVPPQVPTFDELVGRPRSRTMWETFERIYAGLFPQDIPPPLHDPREMVMAEEDRRVFAALDAATAGYSGPNFSTTNQMAEGAARPLTQQDLNPLFDVGLPQPPMAPPETWTVEEMPGQMAINPAALRLLIPQFEIAGNPTINLQEIQARRFDVLEPSVEDARNRRSEELWRRALETNPWAEPPSQNPCREVPLAPREMTRAEMEEIAMIVRRPSWERLLKDPDY